MKEDDDFNLKLLLQCPINELHKDCNLLQLAYKGDFSSAQRNFCIIKKINVIKGKCQKFVSTLTVQKTIHNMWHSSNMEINKARRDHNQYRINSKDFDFRV